MTARWMTGAVSAGLPAEWSEKGDEHHCLGCRRVLAGEAAERTGDGAGTTREQRLQLRKVGTLEFEIRRNPDRPDRAIAHACHTSVPAVTKARRRLA